MKRISAFLLVLMMAFMAGACGKEESPSNRTDSVVQEQENGNTHKTDHADADNFFS